MEYKIFGMVDGGPPPLVGLVVGGRPEIPLLFNNNSLPPYVELLLPEGGNIQAHPDFCEFFTLSPSGEIKLLSY